MKVKVLSRNPDDYVRETKHDIQRGESETRRASCVLAWFTQQSSQTEVMLEKVHGVCELVYKVHGVIIKCVSNVCLCDSQLQQ